MVDSHARNEWIRASQVAMSGLGSHGAFVHLYINGLYWGLYSLVERPDSSFMAAYVGGQEDEWFVADELGPIGNNAASRVHIDHRTDHRTGYSKMYGGQSNVDEGCV